MNRGEILVADDDAAIRTVVAQALSRAGYEVRTTGTAATLWRWVQSGEGDLVVTDVVMPGMGGPTWVMEALKDRPDVRTVFVSGYAEDCLSEAQGRVPHSVFLPKPFSLTELTTTVQAPLAV